MSSVNFKSGEEVDEYPDICERCLGTDRNVKMLKQNNGAECKTCSRPFNVYMWKPSISVKKHSKTIICLTCARARNCCQSCMFDITYGIPLDVRDAALKMAGISNGTPILTATKNKEVKAIMADKLESKFKSQEEEDESSRNQEAARDILTKLSQKLNESSPKFLTSKSDRREHSSANIKDLKNVDISKILSKLPFNGVITPPPADESVTSFFIFGINDDLPQYVINEYIQKFGKVKNLTIVHRAKAGFITFIDRKSAEAFASEINLVGRNKNKATPGILVLDGKYPTRVCWGKPKPLGVTKEEHSKLSLVVTKVLKQLAEKDKKFEKTSRLESSSNSSSSSSNGARKVNERKSQAVGRKAKNEDTKYKTLSTDFEL
ncbi:pre-mRNA-splicing factor Slt11p [[Candida] railenensis]|uniref:Pre-mRNA-splicing factor SLT11 n=1 Tax=[Candida] railenensis TaxID=45579 RepID=A0A9P0QPX4_9ASCO|nr:pre-mRNA-splicing factor Slt11p [[Candida] railenensis]